MQVFIISRWKKDAQGRNVPALMDDHPEINSTDATGQESPKIRSGHLVLLEAEGTELQIDAVKADNRYQVIERSGMLREAERTHLNSLPNVTLPQGATRREAAQFLRNKFLRQL